MRSIPFLVGVVVALGCSDGSSGWVSDRGLSERLVFPASAQSAAEIHARIGVIQIFKTPSDDSAIRSVREAWSETMLLDERDADAIRELVTSLSATVSPPKDCDHLKSPSVIHIMAFDTQLSRVGYIRGFFCQGSKVIALRPLGDAGISYNSELPRVLRERALEHPDA